MEKEILSKYLNYNRRTGIFTWKKRGDKRFDSRYAGTPAGTIHVSTTGRKSVKIKIEGKSYYAHRLAWIMVTGAHPEGVIDHIDHNPLNNKWKNLRDVSQADNMKNRKMPVTNKTGIPNCFFCNKKKKYVVKIAPFGEVGYATNKVDAAKLSKSARIRAGYHHSHGKKCTF